MRIEDHRQKTAHADTVVAVAYSASGGFLASGDRGGDILLWPGGRPGRAQRLRSPYSPLTGIWFDGEGTRLMAGYQDGRLVMYDPSRLKVVREAQLRPDDKDRSRILSGTSRPILDYVVLAASPRGSPWVYAVLEFRDFFQLARADLSVVAKKHLSGNLLEHVATGPDGQPVYFGDDLGYISRYDPAGMQLTYFARHHETVSALDRNMQSTSHDTATGIAALAVSRDARRLVSTSRTGGVQVWDIAPEEPAPADIEKVAPLAARPAPEHGWARGAAFVPDSSRVVYGCDDGSVEIWDPLSGATVDRGKCPEGVRSLAVSPDGSHLAIGGKEGGVFIVPCGPAGAEPAKRARRGWLSLFSR